MVIVDNRRILTQSPKGINLKIAGIRSFYLPIYFYSVGIKNIEGSELESGIDTFKRLSQRGLNGFTQTQNLVYA
jgi:hypothetical protein